MELSGTIKLINPEVQVSASFKKRELVVTTNEQYPQHILVEFAQDKCDILNNYKVGQDVIVGINLRGREWLNPQGETKYFNQIQGWRVEKQQTAPANNTPAAAEQSFTPASNVDDEESDLPFS